VFWWSDISSGRLSIYMIFRYYVVAAVNLFGGDDDDWEEGRTEVKEFLLTWLPKVDRRAHKYIASRDAQTRMSPMCPRLYDVGIPPFHVGPPPFLFKLFQH
jgi:hypothetical protein